MWSIANNSGWPWCAISTAGNDCGNNVSDPFGLVLIWQNRDRIFSVHWVMCFVFNKFNATFFTTWLSLLTNIGVGMY